MIITFAKIFFFCKYGYNFSSTGKKEQLTDLHKKSPTLSTWALFQTSDFRFLTSLLAFSHRMMRSSGSECHISQ